ncbi:MAG: MATE family efflux transporter [Clostridia bacterium]|nr:MATE family efflux transporter [Clostridia bacterium]
MKVQLSDHFTYKKIIKFTLPSVVMMIFTSVYGVVDGLFVSNFVGKTSFAAVNFIIPFLMILGAVGFMFGTGGSAIVARALGQGNKDRANKYFSLFIYASVVLGTTITAVGFVFFPQIARMLGAEGKMLEECVVYGRVILVANVAYILQLEFQSFFITAEKPQLGLIVTVAAGVTNMVLDALFIGVFKWGVTGAALATAASQIVGGVFPVVYFVRPNSSLLSLTKTAYDGKALLKACTNGSSELLSNISMSLVSMLYNIQLIKYAGENGVAAYGVLMYVNFVFISAFIGYSIGTAPIFGYHYGAENYSEMKNMLRKSIVIIGALSVSMFAVGELLAKPLSNIFVSYDKELLELTVRGFYIFAFSFFFAGFAIFGSGLFTALNNGLISAVISFLRTLVFQVGAVLILPLIWEIDGIWISVVAAELMAFAVSAAFVVAMRKKYKYM